jgi:hypothetical protein
MSDLNVEIKVEIEVEISKTTSTTEKYKSMKINKNNKHLMNNKLLLKQRKKYISRRYNKRICRST